MSVNIRGKYGCGLNGAYSWDRLAKSGQLYREVACLANCWLRDRWLVRWVLGVTECHDWHSRSRHRGLEGKSGYVLDGSPSILVFDRRILQRLAICDATLAFARRSVWVCSLSAIGWHASVAHTLILWTVLPFDGCLGSSSGYGEIVAERASGLIYV